MLKNPGKAAAGATLVPALCGAYQVSPSLLLSGQGDALKFMPIMMAPRVISISRGCAAKQHVFCSLVEEILAEAPSQCKLKLQYSRADTPDTDLQWPELKNKFKKRPAQLFALAQEHELTSKAFSDWKHTYSTANFVKRITFFETENSLSSLLRA